MSHVMHLILSRHPFIILKVVKDLPHCSDIWAFKFCRDASSSQFLDFVGATSLQSQIARNILSLNPLLKSAAFPLSYSAPLLPPSPEISSSLNLTSSSRCLDSVVLLSWRWLDRSGFVPLLVSSALDSLQDVGESLYDYFSCLAWNWKEKVHLSQSVRSSRPCCDTSLLGMP